MSAEAVRLLIAAARVAGGTDNITAIVAEVAGGRLAPPRGDDDLPTFREFDPQQEGDPALTSTSHVARRLAARIGLPAGDTRRVLPVTGQHAVMRSEIGIRLPATALPVELDIAGPAVERLRGGTQVPWWWWVVGGAIGTALAWWLGGR